MRRYLIFAAAGLSLFMYSIDSTAVAVAFPNFIREFGTNVLWASWTLSICMVAVASVMPLMGNLSDSFGRKPVFLGSLLLFMVSSRLRAGLEEHLIAWWPSGFSRGLGASFLPTAAGIVRPASSRSTGKQAIGLFSSIFSIGGSSGPTWAAGS